MKLYSHVLVVAGLGLAVAAHADISYNNSFSVSLNDGQDVTNLLLFQTDDNGDGATVWPFSVSGTGETDFSNPFQWSWQPTRDFFVGLTQNLPGDAPGQQHVVLFMDATAASDSAGIDWGTLFPHTDEDQLVAAIQLATSGQDWPIITPGLDAVGNFAGGDAQTGIMNPGGGSQSAWFNANGSFVVETWSSGTIIGTGYSNTQAVPEPCSLAVLGLGAVALIRRRK